MKTIEPKTNGQRLQGAIGDDLFAQPQHISDLKQILNELENKGQNLRPEQIQAILLLRKLGENKYLHGDKNPYEKIYDGIIGDFKTAVVDPNYYLDGLEAVVPKPPKQTILMEKGVKK